MAQLVYIQQIMFNLYKDSRLRWIHAACVRLRISNLHVDVGEPILYVSAFAKYQICLTPNPKTVFFKSKRPKLNVKSYLCVPSSIYNNYIFNCEK